jgi:hypothetical protein
LTAGLAIGLAAGAFDGVVLALPYLKYVGSNLWDALAAFAVTAGLSVFGVYAARFWQAAQHQRAFRRWPEVVVGAVAALGVVAAILVTGVSEDDGPRLFGLSLGSTTFVYILSGGGLVVAAIVAAWLALRRGHGVHALDGVGRVLTRSWPWLAAGLVLLTSAALFARPYFQTARAGANSGGANYIGQVQRILGMPSDPTRSYYENAMRWLSWYFGWFALLLALVGGCWLAFEIANGRRRAWLPVLLVFVITTAAVLARPSITPDHPWADRRFVPVALPAVVMLAFAALALVVERFAPATSRPRSRFRPVVVRVVVLAATAGVVIPAWQGSSAALYAQTEKGEVALVHTVCAALRPGDVVVTFGGRATAEWTGTVRIMCHVPVTYLDGRDNAATLTDIGRRVAANGGRVMVLASGRDDKAKVNVAVDWPAKPFRLMTSEVAHTVVTRPGVRVRNLGFAWPLPFEMWLGPVVINGAAGG